MEVLDFWELLDLEEQARREAFSAETYLARVNALYEARAPRLELPSFEKAFERGLASAGYAPNGDQIEAG